MAEDVYETVALPRFRSILMGTFAAVTHLLTAIGIYGVMAYSVLRRTQEMAVRMALGATRCAVASIVLKSVLMQTAIGLSLGIPIAFVAGHLISGQLYETGGCPNAGGASGTRAVGAEMPQIRAHELEEAKLAYDHARSTYDHIIPECEV